MTSLTGTYEKDGERVVGGTVRSDGSVRPIAKVRPGYIAKEDAPKYKPRGARERDAKLGIVSAESPVVKVDTNASGDDKKAAIKARIEAMKAEFERKKREKEGREDDIANVIAAVSGLSVGGAEDFVKEHPGTGSSGSRESKVSNSKSNTPGTKSNVSSVSKSLDTSSPTSASTSESTKTTSKTPGTSTPPSPAPRTSKLQSRHQKRDKQEVNSSDSVKQDTSSDSVKKDTSSDPVKPETQSTETRTPLKSRHARKTESETKSETKDSTSSGYVPPHKRK
ncbi:hypothetical protein CJU90_1721 [Yarrowia sp. C11]|nr:hypothetical protein CKK34_0448 [Yarrowia sp. E02]KAG5371664.1 hypothetical protein CJU90_1721 [Yarrowia sp. C11]